ncbi:MAG: glucosyltransferase domain-containing protein [Roseburia sp.]|nr:glucosyltransferase domain-containing protein [Roseburia sp.]MCM1098046.1 glucosyltransferase domain-containing protein [Ruminococcus flavefaciens]
MEKTTAVKSEILSDTKKYFFQIRWAIVLIAAAVFAAHGSVLFSQRFGIDTDAVMLGMHSFLDNGRQGLYWLAELIGLDLSWFNLYYAQILTLLFLILSPVAFGWLYHLAQGRGEKRGGELLALLALGVSFAVSPFWTAQIYFLNQSAQVLLAFALTPVAIALAEEARRDLRRKWYLLPGAFLLMQITFSSYQVLVVAYVVGTAVYFLLFSLRERQTLRQSLSWILFHGVVFALNLMLYLGISKLFFMGEESYLKDQILWTQLGFADGLKNCISAVWHTLLAQPPYYTGCYGIFVLFFLALLIRRIWKEPERTRGSRVLMLLSALFVAGSPYLFMILFGGFLVDRMQLIQPFSQGSMLYLTILLLCEEKPDRRAVRTGVRLVEAVLVIALCRDGLTNLNYCSRLYYTDEFVFQYSVRVAADVYRDVKAMQQSEEIAEKFRYEARDNIVILGYPEIPYNTTCVQGSTIGQSIFEFEAIVGNSLDRYRSRYFMQNLGYPLSLDFTEGEALAFRYYFDEYFGAEVDAMPSYPVPGYVKCVLDEETGMQYLVVKLGEDWRTYYWE